MLFRSDQALDALALLGGGRFLPVHWGTFNLGLHAWDQPAERLLEIAPARGVELVMPRLGEVVEPGHTETPRPWWRVVDAPEAERDGSPWSAPATVRPERGPEGPESQGEPVILGAMPDPID